MDTIGKHIKLLGLKARDRITGKEGVVTSISFDLYGCIQAVVTFQKTAAEKAHESGWYDVSRLEILSKKPVIEPPDFLNESASEYHDRLISGRKGAAEKPDR